MTDIIASNPVTVPASGTVTYDKWFLTQLIAKIDPTTGPIVVHLTRGTNAGGHWQLMPRNQGADISFTLDLWKELASDPDVGPAIGAAMEAITAAVVAYGQKHNLL